MINTVRHILGTTLANGLVALFVSIIAASGAATPSVAQTDASGMPVIEQVPLTYDSAKNAMLAMRELKAAYGETAPPTSEAQAWASAMAMNAGAQAIVQNHGFDDTAHWHKTLMSFIMANLMDEEGQGGEMAQMIAQLENNDQIPESVKEQMLERFRALMPSEDNLAVARDVAADPECAALIAELKE